MRVRPLVLLPLSLLLTACPDGGIGRCNDMRDISGQWRMVVQPAAIVKPGVLTIPRATMLTASFAQQPSQNVFGLGSPVWGEIVADDIVVNGRVIGRVRGLKVRLTSTARVEGDIIHKTIAIESGAHFEGSVQRQEDPLSTGAPKLTVAPTTAAGN